VTAPEVLVDTSVAIALVVRGHEAHDRTMDALDGQLLGLAGHAWFETFSVLTRLPPPVRRPPGEVVGILEDNFPGSRFLSEETAAELTTRLSEMGISGGGVYDALVGHTAVAHGLPLATRDRRAVAVYRSLGAAIELLT
jgi:predicted nucleic acid-binding protein